jgi:hypothetical protein
LDLNILELFGIKKAPIVFRTYIGKGVSKNYDGGVLGVFLYDQGFCK